MEIGDLKNLFTYHSPKGDQTERYQKIRDAALDLAVVINECCPESADKTFAIRQLRMAVMTANASIACNE
jgi:hypothetical protein